MKVGFWGEDAMALTEKLDEAIDLALGEERIVGTVVLVSKDGEPIYRRAAGLADRESGIRMRENAIFRLSSLSKPIVSAAALALVDRGEINLDDAIAKWIPEFQPSLPDGSKPEIKIRHLLNHTAGLWYGFFEPEDGAYHQAGVSDGLDQPGLSMSENLKRLASVPLAFQPGESWTYSLGTDVAGEAIARACSCSLPEAVSKLIPIPLGMEDTAFAITDASRLAVPYADGSPQPLRMGELHLVKAAYGPGYIRFAPARVFDQTSYPSGGCGMVGTAGDFLKLLEALRTGGAPILSAQSAKAMISDQTNGRGPGPGVAFGFGLSVIKDPQSAQTPHSVGTFTWGGVYGHSWFVDPAKGLTAVALTNTAVEGVAGKFRADLRDAIYSEQAGE
jgi:CubicO group peptidase (beta-lactamase class C family)